MNMNLGNRDVDLLFELGTLRHLQRTWSQFGGLDFANVAEHSFRVAWIALLLAKIEGAEPGRVCQLALAHDVPEARTGDVNYVQRMHTLRNEDAALKDCLDSTSLREEVLMLWEELEACETIEARVVKDADSLDCDLELVEQIDKGAKLPSKLVETRRAVERRLYTQGARRLFGSIYNTDPHRWHLESRNRLTDGDWAQAGDHASSSAEPRDA